MVVTLEELPGPGKIGWARPEILDIYVTGSG
jgi:hypothetical protein